MPYPALDLGKIGPGMPLDPSNFEALYKGNNKTNGFLMRNVNGRLPALEQPVGRLSIDIDNVLSEDGVVTWGNGLWRDIGNMDTRSGFAYAQKPTKAFLVGVLKFDQGWQAGNPVMPHGVPQYSKATIITKGLVGYKTAMTAVGVEEEYLAFLKGDTTQDIAATRTTYNDWMTAIKAGADGSKLAVFFENTSGFPVVSIVTSANLNTPTLTGATFGGFASVYEKENGAVFFSIGEWR